MEYDDVTLAELKAAYEDRASAVLQNLEYENTIKKLLEEIKSLKSAVEFWKIVASTADQM